MRILHELRDIRDAIADTHAAGRSLGWVGTSGALHDGHLSLVRSARADNDSVMMFWNGSMTFPWAAGSAPSYPRDLDRDAAMAADAGVDVLWIPHGEQLFPEPPSIRLTVPRYHRPGLMSAQHLDVVALFMTKYLSMLGRCSCYMGEKDWEQMSHGNELVRIDAS